MRETPDGRRLTRRQAQAGYALVFALGVASTACAQDALRGKMLYHDIGQRSGAGVSCIDCHGGFPGALHGIGRAAGMPAAIEQALATIHQMAPLRGRVTHADMADLAAYLARPDVPSPDLRTGTIGPDGGFTPTERVNFAPGTEPGAEASATIRLANAGAIAVRLGSGPILAGPDAAQFAITASDCTAGRELAFGQACSVSVAFRPRGEGGGLRTASLGMEHDWLRGGTYLALIGRSPVR
ncbi:MAG: hypothetical protein FJX53_15990 [Alphaproteobacteria bacterium]|nr:hypothetical protein [Alphaproteobacteria bacterium]